MALTDTKVRAAKVPTGKKSVKLSDGEGLFLFVTPSSKTWKQKYRLHGKESTYTHGKYPAMTLKQARKGCADVKALLSAKTDPNQQKQSDQRAKLAKANAATFEGLSREFIKHKAAVWSVAYTHDSISRMEKHIFPWIGSLKAEQVRAPDLLDCLRRIEDLGFIEAAHKSKMLCGQVFRYGAMIGVCEGDPSQALKGALQARQPVHRPCLKKPKDVGGLMHAIAGFSGTLVVKCALQLSPLVFVRPTELRHAEWKEIDLAANLWRIPASKMKMKTEHIVPLSNQAMAILKEIQFLTGGGRYVFPNIRKPARPMSENTINNALQRIGYDTKTEQCAHGFRGMASTLLHEQGFNTDYIERQLAHKEGNAIKAAYNHARHLPERVEMMQVWANYLDGLRDGATRG
ncbi:MAG: tyrosine-type recombinase/integrase [Mariprofundaceae bacterium]|nr:tyrosine-type recombinase/integrase [Mariprofundaceae bacterium]